MLMKGFKAVVIIQDVVTKEFEINTRDKADRLTFGNNF